MSADEPARVRAGPKPLPPLEAVQGLLRYDPTAPSGLRWRRFRRGRAVEGAAAGSRKRDGYYEVKIHNRCYSAHRIVWLLCTGEDPRGAELDHIDPDAGNAIENLRLATKSQNAANRRPAAVPSASRYKGVRRDSTGRRWVAAITVDGATERHLGTFSRESHAATAYNRAAARGYGEYARFNVLVRPGETIARCTQHRAERNDRCDTPPVTKRTED